MIKTGQKLLHTVILFSIFLLAGGNASAQQTWEIPITKYGNGQNKLVGIFQGKTLKKAKQIGIKKYYETGALKMENILQSDGLYLDKEYYQNGQLAKTGSSKHLVPSHEGPWKSYYSNGQLWQVGTFSYSYSDKEDYKEYYPTGILKATGKIVGFGKAVGVWTFYNENGEVEKTEDFGEGRELSRDDIDEESKEFDLLD